MCQNADGNNFWKGLLHSSAYRAIVVGENDWFLPAFLCFAIYPESWSHFCLDLESTPSNPVRRHALAGQVRPVFEPSELILASRLDG